MLSKPRGAPFAAWITGWISLVGHVAATTALRFVIPSFVMRKSSADWRFMPSSSFACANFISIAATLRTNYHPNSHKTIGIYAAVLFLQGMIPWDHSQIPANLDAGTINTFGLRVLKRLSNVSVWWHLLATISLVIAILAKAPTHQSGKFVFRTFVDETGLDGVGWSQRASTAYVGVIGSLFAQYGLTGRSTRRIVWMDIHLFSE
jgi:hypothetical protein